MKQIRGRNELLEAAKSHIPFHCWEEKTRMNCFQSQKRLTAKHQTLWGKQPGHILFSMQTLWLPSESAYGNSGHFLAWHIKM